MKIMSIVYRIAYKARIVSPISETRLVELHPWLVRFFDHRDQITILSQLWYQGKFTRAQCMALNQEMCAVIDDIIRTCNMM